MEANEEQKPQDDSNYDSGNQKKYFSAYAKYSAIGFQMFAVIAVFAFIGYEIDKYQNSKTPLWTAFLSLAGVFCSLYLVIRSVKNLDP